MESKHIPDISATGIKLCPRAPVSFCSPDKDLLAINEDENIAEALCCAQNGLKFAENGKINIASFLQLFGTTPWHFVGHQSQSQNLCQSINSRKLHAASLSLMILFGSLPSRLGDRRSSTTKHNVSKIE